MSTTRNKLALSLGAAALALGGTAGVAGLAHADPTATPSASASASASATQDSREAQGSAPQHEGRQGHRGGEDAMAKKLASALGTDETKTKEALQKAHEEMRAAQDKQGSSATEQSAEQREDAEASSIASTLGVDKAKVTAAFESLKTEAQSQHRTELKTRLDKAVSAGTLTQADEDSILKAFDAGVLEGGPHQR